MVIPMSKMFAVVILALMLSLISATYLEKTLATSATEYSFSNLTTTSQNGSNTYLLLGSNNSADTAVVATIYYMNSTYAKKTANYTLTGTTPVNTSAVTTYSYNISSTTNAVASFNIDLNNYWLWTLKGTAINATRYCANYTNVFHIEATGANFTSNMNATSNSSSVNTVVDSKAVLYDANISSIALNNNTTLSVIWYYYNPALNLTGYVNTTATDITAYTLPPGEYFNSTTAFVITGEGFNGTVTVSPNDNRTYNLTANAKQNSSTNPSTYVIPSNRLVQNRRVIVSGDEVAKCRNATIASSAAQNNISSDRYNRTGSNITSTSDFAYVYDVRLSAGPVGNVTINDSSNINLYWIRNGNITIDNNNGSNMCINAAGCTVSNLVYSADALWKMTAKIWRKTGANTTVFSTYLPIGGQSTAGTNIIKWGAGERLVFYGTPRATNTNTTLYYEVN